MTPNISLVKQPEREDFDNVTALAARNCYCSENMKAELQHGDETICRPCAARQVLNGVTSLVDEAR